MKKKADSAQQDLFAAPPAQASPTGETEVCRVWPFGMCVRVETAPGVAWEMPNPTPSGRVYNPAGLANSVRTVGRVRLDRWVRINDAGEDKSLQGRLIAGSSGVDNS